MDYAKHKRLEQAEEDFDILIARDFNVVRFSEWHWRVNEAVDIWPTSRKYFDRMTGTGGSYHDLIPFVRDYFAEKEETRKLVYGIT